MAENLSVARIGAHDIHYVDAGNGFPILLIHGLAGDHNGWTPQIAAWSRIHRVIAPDSRGAGRSTQLDEPISTADMARDMLALLDHLGIDKTHVIGRSMGGAIAQHMALLAPKRVHSLTMCASFAKIDPFGHRVLTNMRDILERTGSWAVHAQHSVQNFVSADFFDTHPERIKAIEQLIGGETRLQACYIRQNHACLEHDTLARLHEIRCPTLVLGGGRDPICPPVCTRWISDGIQHAETVMFEESSHFFLMEQPERFMQVMNDWITRNTPAS